MRKTGWLFLIGMIPSWVNAEVTLQNRQLYAEASQAVDERRWNEVEALRQQLAGYPLDIYLDFFLLESRLRQVSGAEAQAFLGESAGTPLQIRFKDKYLRRAGRDRRWEDFLQVASSLPRDVELQCYFHRARLAEGNRDAAWAGASYLWNHGESRPKACDPLFDAWLASGQLNDEIAWSRMMKAVDERQGGLAQYAGRLGGEALQPWVETMMTIYRHPASLAQQSLLPAQEPLALDIIAHGFPRLARVDVVHALRLWKRYRSVYPFSAQQAQKIQDSIAFYTLLRKTDAHKRWLDEYLLTRQDDKLLERRLRWVLAEGDWADYLYLVSALSPSRQQAGGWRFWSAVALSEQGKQAQAETLFLELAGERDFYGFLAAERIGKDYSLNHEPLQPEQQAQVLNHSGVQRASELLFHDEEHLARSEWNYVLNQLDVASKEQLAHYAINTGWYRFGIDAANHAEAWDRLELRFPSPFEQVFVENARLLGVPETELLSISRRESAFAPSARSQVGARGLMQLMPATARSVARRLGDTSLSSDLYDIDNNVRLGSAYYRQLLDSYGGNRVFSLAAYNAGPQRVRAWRTKDGSMDVYRWVEAIPFRETREYVQGVLAYNVVYNALAGQSISMLSEGEKNASY